MDRTELRARLEKHHREAFGWALSRCDWNRTLAEDVLQTSYLKILDGRAVFGGRSHFRTWLFGVIRRTAAEHHRRRRLRSMLPLPQSNRQEHSAQDDLGGALERAEEATKLLNALRQLAIRQQEVLHLVFYQDLTIREAADVLQISIGTARTHYERGKQRLRELLGGNRTDE